MTMRPTPRPTGAIALLLIAGLLAPACSDDGTSAGTDRTTTTGTETTAPDTTPPETTAADAEPVIDPGDGGDYAPELDPAEFVATIDNPYLPLTPGSRWVYEETDAEGVVEDIVVEVTGDTKEILGITATVVRDTVTKDGVLVEDTFDWYAQDAEGTVWYLGEDVSNYDEEGQLVDRDGSFEAGVDGALPGIVMLADPTVGAAYRQELYRGEAEDLGEVLAVGGDVSVPAGDFTDVIVTRDWNPLDPDVVEEKTYAPGVGVVFEEKVQGDSGEGVLIEHTPG